MSKFHNHVPECAHEEVKFCKPCKKPYCVSCGKEWQEYAFTYTYPFYSNQYNKLYDNSNTLNDGHTVELTSTCNHLQSK